jgi:hypothetical protein
MREREMQRDCQELGIGREFWKGSRLGGALRHHWTDQDTQDSGGIYGMCQLDHACNIGNHKSTQNMISFTFDPEERDIDSEDASNSIFTWNPVLVKCIESYYESGRIRVPDESLGNDVLLVLEFFGIVYSPQQLVFDSFGCFLRVKLWTDYYSHRATMADWIVHQLITSHSRLSHAFCTCPEALDPKSCLYVGTKRCDPLDGGLFLDNSRSDSDPDPQSCSGAYTLGFSSHVVCMFQDPSMFKVAYAIFKFVCVCEQIEIQWCMIFSMTMTGQMELILKTTRWLLCCVKIFVRMYKIRFLEPLLRFL